MIRVFTAFSGYDSQLLALDMLHEAYPEFTYRCVGWSEIDKNAILAHNALYPELKDLNYGDISKIDWTKVEDMDLFTYSFPCFTSDSLILTRDGYKQFNDLEVGELVLARDGQYHRIAKKFINGRHPTCYLEALGFERLHVTYNHKFLVRTMSRKWNAERNGYDRVFSEPEYKEAVKLERGDYFGIPCETPSALPRWFGVRHKILNRISNRISQLIPKKSFWYLMGRYLGDGWKKRGLTGQGIVICCGGRHEQELVDAINDCGYHYSVQNERSTRRYIICSNELNSFVNRYGYMAHGKKIDGETMNLPLDLLEGFVEGCLDSDGCNINDRLKYVTVSRELAYGLSFCINRVYKRHCSIHYCKRESTQVIDGRTCNQRDTYHLAFTKEERPQDRAFYEDGYIWYPFTRRTPGSVENVYNIEVEDEHSYIIQGCISKNCTDISNAGLQAGFEKGSGTRSSLLWECEEAIRVKRPKYLLMENVKALVGKKNLPLFNKWLNLLSSYGYRNFTKVLNATQFGVPQNRERVFCISILGDEEYHFPMELGCDIVCNDILEDGVDPSFFIKGDKMLKVVSDCYEKENSSTD